MRVAGTFWELLELVQRCSDEREARSCVGQSLKGDERVVTSYYAGYRRLEDSKVKL
jgi:hypothetical protein